jgi:lipopolysaccharide transport system permease protein
MGFFLGGQRSEQFRHRLQLTIYKIRAEIKGEIDRNYLGFAWWVIEPLMYLAAFYLVFGVALDRGGEGFVGFLLVGLVVWKWFDVSVRQSMSSIGKNRGLLEQAYVPKYLFPLITVGASTFKFLIIFHLLLLFLLLYGVEPSYVWMLAPGLILLQLMLALGVALLVGAWVPLLQDVRPLIENGMMMLFFLSGVFFDLSSLQEPLRTLFSINPEAVLIDAFRQVLLYGNVPELPGLVWVTFCAACFGGAGLYTLNRFDRVYPKVL